MWTYLDWCADEGGSCFGYGRVYYGDGGVWTYQEIYGDWIACNSAAFFCDPLPGTGKKCYFDKWPVCDSIQIVPSYYIQLHFD